MRVVLATREDPRLGLHRLRLSGQLTELRAPDLRFSMEETVELLRADGITLSDRAVAQLYERTEGWAAGLRLAVISLARHPDPERFVTEFSGSERNVAAYLLAEVLERQTPEVREHAVAHLDARAGVWSAGRFPDRRRGRRADAAGARGRERVRDLRWMQGGLGFATTISSRTCLQLELRRAAPAMVGSLHRAAAEWYEQHGFIVEAIRHAQAARDWRLASRLLADHHIDLTFDGRAGSIAQLLSAFPDEVAGSDAELAIVFATARLLDGSLERSATFLELARRLADTVATERRPGFDLLLAEVSLVLARWRGDLDTVLQAQSLVEAALAAQPPRERTLSEEFRSVALLNLGVAELWSSRLDDAAA